MTVKPIPDGYHSVTPYLICRDAAKAIAFYQKAFGAEEKMRMPGPDGKIAHAEIRIGDSNVMLSDEHPKMNFVGPATLNGTTVMLMIYVKDCDAVYDQAIKAGATSLRPLANQFYGDRSGTVKDPFGHIWTLSTHVEDVSDEEIVKRMKAMGENCGG